MPDTRSIAVLNPVRARLLRALGVLGLFALVLALLAPAGGGGGSDFRRLEAAVTTAIAAAPAVHSVKHEPARDLGGLAPASVAFLPGEVRSARIGHSPQPVSWLAVRLDRHAARAPPLRV